MGDLWPRIYSGSTSLHRISLREDVIMPSRKSIAVVATVGIVLLGWRLADTIMVVRAVSPPHASHMELFKAVVHPPYQMAAPNRRFFKGLRFSLIPLAEACAAPTCNGMESKPSCCAICGCPSYACGYCPNCVTGPCTPYTCQYTGKAGQLCTEADSTEAACKMGLTACPDAKGGLSCSPPGKTCTNNCP